MQTIAKYILGKTTAPHGYLPLTGWTVNYIMLPLEVYAFALMLMAVTFLIAHTTYKRRHATAGKHDVATHAALCALLAAYLLITIRSEILWTPFVKYASSYSDLSADQKFAKMDIEPAEGAYATNQFLLEAKKYVDDDYDFMFADGPRGFGTTWDLLEGKVRIELLPHHMRPHARLLVVIGKNATYSPSTRTLSYGKNKITGLDMLFPHSPDKFILSAG